MPRAAVLEKMKLFVSTSTRLLKTLSYLSANRTDCIELGIYNASVPLSNPLLSMMSEKFAIILS